MFMKIHRFVVNKLIRDNMIEFQTKQGVVLHERILDTAEFNQRIHEKLIEEAHEVIEARTRQDLIEELADLTEVMHAIMTHHKILLTEVEQTRLKKHAERGGFEKKIFSTTIDIRDDKPALAYYKARPQQYPEIDSE